MPIKNAIILIIGVSLLLIVAHVLPNKCIEHGLQCKPASVNEDF